MTTPKRATQTRRPAAKPEQEKASDKEVSTVKVFVSVKQVVYHPFAEVYIPTGPPGVGLDVRDSWLECQIARGLVKEL